MLKHFRDGRTVGLIAALLFGLLYSLYSGEGLQNPTNEEAKTVKFIVSWTFPQATYGNALNKFLSSGGMPPANVRLIGRWHGMDGSGFAVAETDDPKGLYAWYAEWLEFLPVTTTPCLEDGDAAAVLQSMKR